MEESYACLTRSFYQPSSDEKKGNPLQHALTTSVSFGRFMSESLDWEKWSTFTHNRYLEEVEKYSKPGSVAEKKAYFEARYKRRRAAALLEQRNAATTDFSESNTTNKVENNAQSVVTDTIKEEKDQNSNAVCPVGQSDGDIGDIMFKQEYNVCKKDDSTMRNSVSPSEKNPEVSFSNLLTNGGASKHAPSIKQITNIRLKNNDKIPNSKNDARDLSNKRRSYATSLHMSINFASCSGETRKPTSPNLPKITKSRLISKSKNNVLPQTSTKASMSGIFKHHSSTTQPENRRTTTLHLDSISESKTDGKLQNPSTNNSKSSSTFGCKARSLTVSSYFTFKSEERVAKRKEFFEKLEQKCKSKETEKQQINAKLQILQDRTAFKVQDNNSRPPWRFSSKTDNRSPICSAKAFWKKSSRENASPNIRL